MFRRDYILNAIAEFGAILEKIIGLSNDAQWQAASVTASGAFERLIGVKAVVALEMSDTELFARLIQDGPTQLAETKILMLAALFKVTGNVLTGEGKSKEAVRHYVKGLELLLAASAHTDVMARPDFAPTVEEFLSALGNAPLPARTNVLLMRHFEMAGDFGRAEEALFALAETGPPSAGLREFGEAFYQRLLEKSDADLASGNLSRTEATSGLAELRHQLRISP